MDKLIAEGKFEMVKNWTHVRGQKAEDNDILGKKFARQEHFMFVVRKK